VLRGAYLYGPLHRPPEHVFRKRVRLFLRKDRRLEKKNNACILWFPKRLAGLGNTHTKRGIDTSVSLSFYYQLCKTHCLYNYSDRPLQVSFFFLVIPAALRRKKKLLSFVVTVLIRDREKKTSVKIIFPKSSATCDGFFSFYFKVFKDMS